MTKQRPSLLVLATPDWEGTYMKSTVALTQELARSFRTLYVEHPPTLTQRAREAIDGNAAALQWSAELRSAASAPDLHVLTPAPVLPVNALPQGLYEVVLQTNALSVRRTIRRVLRQLDFSAPIVLNALNPHYGVALAGAFNERARVYYCFDEVRARTWNGRHGGRMEDRYLSMVDAAVATSPALHERLSEQHPNAHLVRNGVDFDLFYQAARPASPPTSRPPCIGYVGSLDDRIDYPLLERLIRAHSDWRFRFVGRIVDADAERMSHHANVVLTGPKPPEHLPDELRQMDVGLIPFERTEFTRNIYPLKVNEYLAAGLPVVATDFSDLSEFSDRIAIMDTADAFLEAVEAAAHADASDEQRDARIETARANSWEHRGQKLRRILDDVLQESPSQSTAASKC